LERCDLQPSELLVLSFTRAVVRELRRRDREHQTPSRILPETFDSFASRLLRECSPDDRWQQAGFRRQDRRRQRVLESGAAGDLLGRVRHVLVDETQDLVGVRSDFIRALLTAPRRRLDGLRRPGAGIYDHQSPAEAIQGYWPGSADVAETVLRLDKDLPSCRRSRARDPRTAQHDSSKIPCGRPTRWDVYYARRHWARWATWRCS
jgi:hypothetical protein